MDIVSLDLDLPRKNGDEVLEELPEDPELRCVPVIVPTSSPSEADVVRSDDRCANAYLAKPVDPDGCIEPVRAVEQCWLSVVRRPD